MDFRDFSAKNSSETNMYSNVSKRSKIILIAVVVVVAISILIVAVGGAVREEYKEEHFVEYYHKAIDQKEVRIANEAFARSQVEMEESAEGHLRLLFLVLWLYRDVDTADIDIVSAELVPFSNADVSDIVGENCDGYALNVTMRTGDIYTVWDSNGFERILKNHSEEIWITPLMAQY